MSNFVGLHTALTGLRASQYGLDTASHNVANASTTGFTRQRVELQASHPFASPVGPLGTGVTITGIARVRDAFLDARVRTTLGEFTSLDARTQLLSRAEQVLGEPGTGIAGALGELWNAFEDLAMDPAGAGPRRQVLGALESLTSRVRSVATGWDSLGQDTGQRLHTDLAEVNDRLRRVNELNATILSATTGNGAQPSDLMDERDVHLDRLAELVGATVTTDADGRAVVTIGGVSLPSRGAPPELALDGAAFALSDGSAPDGWWVGGQVGGTARFLVRDLPGMRGELDDLAARLAAGLNAQHARGITVATPPAAGGGLLVFDAAAGAASLALDPAVAADPRLLAAAAAPDAPHDGGNAAALAGVRTLADGDRTIEQRYQHLLTAVASDVATSRRAADGQPSLAVAAQSARLGVHGVSLDEEMADVVRFQRSLEAMSRVMSAIDQALDVLINRTGIVGR